MVDLGELDLQVTGRANLESPYLILYIIYIIILID